MTSGPDGLPADPAPSGYSSETVTPDPDRPPSSAEDRVGNLLRGARSSSTFSGCGETAAGGARSDGTTVLERGLADLGCAALLVVATSSRDPDLAHWVGPAHLGRSFLLLSAGGEPRLGFYTPMERQEAAATGLALLDPETLGVPRLAKEGADEARLLAETLERGLELAGVAPGRIALAGSGPAGEVHAAASALSRADWTVVPGNDLARRLRKTKTAAELAEIRRVAAGAMAAFRAVAERLAAAEERPAGGGARELWSAGERLTAGRLRREIAMVLAGRGLEQPAGNIVAAGADGGVPHTTGDDARVLRAGEPLVVDLYPHGRLFADCTRTFCVGRPPEGLRAAHAAVAAALAEARRDARPGVRGWSLQEAVCARFAQAGYPTPLSDASATRGYVHGLGHGVGFELHEEPSFRRHAGAEGVLADGDVFTLEPGLYDPAAGWGVRLEDLVTLQAGEIDLLTPLPYALDPRAWRG